MSTDTKDKREPRECNCLSNFSHAVQHNLETLFGNIGRVVGRNPWLTILLSVIISGSFAAGFANWTTESRVNKLWIPQNTLAEQHSVWVSDTFGFETRTEKIMLRPKNEGNVLTAKYVEQYWMAHNVMINYTAPAAEGYEDRFPGLYSWDGHKGTTSICLRLGQECEMLTILDITGYQRENITDLTDEKLLQLLNDPVVTKDIDLPKIIGGLEYDSNDQIISGAILAGTYSVEAATIEENNEFADPSREEWESGANAQLLSFDCSDCKVIPYFEAAFGEEFSGAVGADGINFSAGLFLLIIYATIALGKRDYVHSMAGLALCSVITVALAIIASFGLSGALKIIYTPLSSSLPFLALGLGVDDAFIIVGQFQLQIRKHLTIGNLQEMTVEKLMEETMKHAGVSILITSVTDFVAFAIGASTVLPALSSYCLFAAFGVLFVFLLNITFFCSMRCD